MDRDISDQPKQYIVEQALDVFKELNIKCSELQVAEITPKLVLSELHKASRNTQCQPDARRFLRAEAKIVAGRIDEALKIFDSLVNNPKASQLIKGLAYDRLGDIYWLKKDLQRAEDAYLEALQIRPKDKRTQMDLARVLWNTGRKKDIFRALECNSECRVEPETEYPVKKRIVQDVIENTWLYTSPSGSSTAIIQGKKDKEVERYRLTGDVSHPIADTCELAWALWSSRHDVKKIPNMRLHIIAPCAPNDGTSLGLAVYCTIGQIMDYLSLREKIALTGQIDLRGQLLPVMDIEGKVLAAYLSGHEEVYIPRDNLQMLPPTIKTVIDIHTISSVVELEEFLC